MTRWIVGLAVYGIVAGTALPGAAANRRVDIVNKTGMDMKHFYASTSGNDDWEEDILGQDLLSDGETFDVNIDDGTGKCLYDFKAVFENGTSLVRNKINVCEISTFTYRP